MKRIFALLSIIFVFFSFDANAQAACGTCTPNAACYLPGGTQCPLSGFAPVMYQYQQYSTDVTFYMPSDTNISGIGNVQIVNVEYQSITGLPLGITWQTNKFMQGNNYSPSNGEQLACIRFCGTPMSPPGTYTAVIKVLGTANVLGGITQTEYIYFDFVIAAPTSGNAYFNYVVNNTCDSSNVDYSANVVLGPPQMVDYNWNFGNGNTSTSPNPPTQFYNTPGIYTPSLNTIVYNTRLKSLNASAIGGWYNGDVEEPFSSTAADLQFSMNHGTSTYTSSEVSNNANPSWNNLNVVLQGWTLTFTWVENDVTSPNDQGGSTTVHITGPGTYNASTTAISSGGGGVNFSFVIDKVVANNNTTVDTFQIFASPLEPVITASPAAIVCEENLVTLTIDPGNFLYEWYKDNILITDTLQNSITVVDTGYYHVVVTDLLSGCSTQSAPFHVGNYPGIYGTSITNNAGVLNVLSANPNYDYQWLYNGNPIFPNGNGTSLTPSFVGDYAVIATNQYGCSDTSNSIFVSSFVGIEEAPLFSDINLYPNPTTNDINLQFTAYQNTEMKFSIIDPAGKELFVESINVPQGKFIKNYQVGSLAPGFYMIKISNGSKMQTLRFIKK